MSARLTIEAPALEGLGAVKLLEIRGADLRLAAMAAAGVPVELAPGLYTVSLPRPVGGRLTRGVLLEDEEDAVVNLDDGGEEAQVGPASEEQLAPRDSERRGMRPPWELDPELDRLLTRMPRLRYRTRGLRLERVRGDFPIEVRVIDADTAEPREAEVEIKRSGPERRAVVTIRPEAVPAEPLLAQVEGLVQGVVNAMLPLSRREARPTAVELTVSVERVMVQVSDDPRVRALASYLTSGQFMQASDVATADDLLREKRIDPVAAALGGYSLLRAGRLENRREWALNLQQQFQWLPDGAILVGEAARREGDFEKADRSFDIALERGMPLFSDGLSLLNTYLRGHGASGGDPKARRIRAAAALADYGSPMTTYPGSNPLRPAETEGMGGEPADA